MAHNLILKYINKANIRNAFFHFRTYGLASMLRKTSDYLEFTKNYNIWHRSHTISDTALAKQKNTIFPIQPKISIIVPVYKTPEIFLHQMINSVLSQTYSNWELCIADGSADPKAAYISTIISEYQKSYPNIIYTKLTQNLGISGNTNAALSLASGSYIALLDHDDLLAPNALFEIVSTISKHPDADVVYTDEDKVDIQLQNYFDPYFKPDFNLDLLRSCNYITHFYVVRQELVQKSGGFSVECNGSQDYDFILKTCELAKNIYHIPQILYHWRIHPASVAGNPESKTYAYDSAVRALQMHLDRCQENATASKDAQFGYYKITYHTSGTPLISIILDHCASDLPTKIKNFSSYNYFEVVNSPEKASGEYLVFLHHIKDILSSDWLEQLLGNASRSSVGIVGGRILYTSKKILEAGLIYTYDGYLHSPFYRFHSSDTGYCYRAIVQQNCSFIGPYCYMIKNKLYKTLCPIPKDASSPHEVFDICNALRERNLLIVYNPKVSVLCNVKHEILPKLKYCETKNDPFYNPNLSEQNFYHLK